MIEIHTTKGLFDYVGSTYRACIENVDVCSSCMRTVSQVYVKIIRKLKEAGLLDQDYKLMCCFCYGLEKMREKILRDKHPACKICHLNSDECGDFCAFEF